MIFNFHKIQITFVMHTCKSKQNPVIEFSLIKSGSILITVDETIIRSTSIILIYIVFVINHINNL
jgi:hypothetical protein